MAGENDFRCFCKYGLIEKDGNCRCPDGYMLLTNSLICILRENNSCPTGQELNDDIECVPRASNRLRRLQDGESGPILFQSWLFNGDI
jgi:hypothetical protein